MGHSAQPLEEEPFQGIDHSITCPIQDLGSKTEAVRTASAPRGLGTLIEDLIIDGGLLDDRRKRGVDEMRIHPHTVDVFLRSDV